MNALDISAVTGWHAHVYFDASSREAANAFRELILAHLGGVIEMGRFHERPVGPHPLWSYQLAFTSADFGQVMTWLTLNHGALDVFLHPNTGNGLVDHRDRAVWIGRSHVLNLGMFSR